MKDPIKTIALLELIGSVIFLLLLVILFIYLFKSRPGNPTTRTTEKELEPTYHKLSTKK